MAPLLVVMCLCLVLAPPPPSGSKGYSSLKQKSVKTAKKAEKIAETAVSLAKKGHSEKVQAREEIAKVKKALKKPDAEHASEETVGFASNGA